MVIVDNLIHNVHLMINVLVDKLDALMDPVPLMDVVLQLHVLYHLHTIVMIIHVK